MTMLRLENKVAIITGASSGIGMATAKRFAEEGALLILNDQNEEALAQLKEELVNGNKHQFVCSDISKEETATLLVQTAMNYGKIDILINNAGIHFIKDITDCEAEDFDHVFGINLKSMFLCCKHVIPHMVQQQKGSIINLSSISALVGQEMMGKSTFMYNMTKAGAQQLTRSLATRYASEGIRVNCVAPGATKTNQITEEMVSDLDAFWGAVAGAHPVGRVGTPKEIANCILFLASDEASFVTGSALVCDGGYTVQ